MSTLYPFWNSTCPSAGNKPFAQSRTGKGHGRWTTFRPPLLHDIHTSHPTMPILWYEYFWVQLWFMSPPSWQNFKLSQSDHQAQEVPHDMIRLIPQKLPSTQLYICPSPLPLPVSITHLAGTAKAYVLSARRNSALLADASKANSKALERRKTWRGFGAEGGKHA